MSKETKFLDYNTLIRDNLLNVVKHALSKTADYGLTDGHHFYITFNTKFKDNIKVLNNVSLDKNLGLVIFVNIKQQDVFFKKLEHLPHLNIMDNVSKNSNEEVFISNKKSSSKIFFEDFSNHNVSFLIDLIETAFIEGIADKWQR